MIQRRELSTVLRQVTERFHVPGWTRTVLGIAILAAVVGFFVHHAGHTLSSVREAWQPVMWRHIFVSFLLLLVCLFVMSVLWYWLVGTLKGEVRAFTAVTVYGLSLLPRYVPGLVWGYVGRIALCERAGVRRRVAMGSIIAEVGLIVGAGAIVAMVGRLTWRWVLLPCVPGVVLLLGAVSSRYLHRRRWVSRFKRIGTWYGLLLAYIAFWLLYGLSSWFAVLSVAPDTRSALLPRVMVSTVLAWFAGFVAIVVPGGLGVREGVFVATLTPILGPTNGLLVPLVMRLIALGAEGVFFAGSALLLRIGRPDLDDKGFQSCP